MFEERNEFGFPIVLAKREAALAYAAEAKERNKPECECDLCKQAAMLPTVQRIIENWKS